MELKPTLLTLKGLPASGKSTYAQTLVDEGWVRSNKDDIRLDPRLFPQGYNFKNKGHEKRVIRERNRIVTEALASNKNVVVDDTNLNPVHIKELSAIAKQYNAEFRVDESFLSVSLQECIDRDRKREKMVGASVIRGMFHQYIKVPPSAIVYDPSLPNCFISDIDGTLTKGPKDRSPYDWSKVGQDEIREATSSVLDAINLLGDAKIFIFSGRDGVCRPETEEWLERHDVEYEALFMRKPNDNRNDADIKRELLFEHIVGKYNVLGIFDDRPRVCRMWRDELGITVFQLGDPYFEF